MKTLLCSLTYVLFALTAFGQDITIPVTREESQKEFLDKRLGKAGYQTTITGWVIHKGDTLQLGKGSLPSKDFAFIRSGINMMAPSSQTKQALGTSYSGKSLILKYLGSDGNRKTGYSIYGIVGIGGLVNYIVEIENAIQAGEILPPVKFRPSAQTAPALPVSVADELLKLKSLLDAGAITQAEYDAQKKKLLSN